MKGVFTFGGGVGFSLGFLGAPYNFGPTYPVPLAISTNAGTQAGNIGFSPVSAVLNAFFDYGITPRMSLALTISNQQEVITYYTNPTDNVSRLNVAARILYHLNKYNDYFDNYIGIRIGYSYWKDQQLSTSPFPEPAIGSSTLYKPSFQFFYGLTWFPEGGIIGFNIEAAIGTPYQGQAGLLFRI